MILLYFSAREMLANKDVKTGSMGGKYNDSFHLMFQLKGVCDDDANSSLCVRTRSMLWNRRQTDLDKYFRWDGMWK